MATVETFLVRVVAALEPRLEDLVEEMVERMTAELPELVELGGAELIESLRESARSQLRMGFTPPTSC